MKGVACRIYWVVLDVSTGNPITGGLDTPAATLSIDGAAFASATNTPTEIGTSGYGYLDLTVAEMGCNGLCINVTSADASAKAFIMFVYPVESTFLKANGPTRFEHWLQAVKAFCWNKHKKNNDNLTIYDDDEATELGIAQITEAGSITTRGMYQ